MIPGIVFYAVVLTLVVYCITKVFSIKEYHEKQKESLFGWMHGNLIEEIYIPIVTYSKGIADVLRWREKNKHQKNVLLFVVSKFLESIYKNRELIGGDEFFTQNKSSNKCLRNLSERTVYEISELYSESGDRCKAFVTIFLALCGRSKNYYDFIAVMDGNLIYNKKLFNEIQLMKNYVFANNNYYQIITDPISSLIDNEDIIQLYKRTKLCVLCAFFSTLLSHEISRIYKAWFLPHNDGLRFDEFLITIKATLSFIDDFQPQIDKYINNKTEFDKISDEIKTKEKQIEVAKNRLSDQSARYNRNEIEIFIKNTTSNIEELLKKLYKIKIFNEHFENNSRKKLIKLCAGSSDLLRNNKLKKENKIGSIESSISWEMGKLYATQFFLLLLLPIIAILVKYIINSCFQSNFSIRLVPFSEMVSFEQILSIIIVIILIKILFKIINNIFFLKIKLDYKEIRYSIFDGLSIAILFLTIVILLSIYYGLQFDVQILGRMFKI